VPVALHLKGLLSGVPSGLLGVLVEGPLRDILAADLPRGLPGRWLGSLLDRLVSDLFGAERLPGGLGAAGPSGRREGVPARLARIRPGTVPGVASVVASVIASVVGQERVHRRRAAECGLPALRPAGERFSITVGPVGT
jgi:hypothetical protein